MSGEEPSPRAALSALSDLVVLAEPLLLRVWRSSRVTLGHLRVLRALRDQERSPGELAALVGVSAPSMARMLASLETRDLISRAIDLRDRRRIEVSLRPLGRELVASSHVWRESAFARAAQALDPDQRESFITAVSRFTELVRRESEGLDGSAAGGAESEMRAGER